MPAMDYAKIAELYDLYAATDLDVPFFIQEAQGRQNVLELTSGTGRLSIPLIVAGVPLSCLDSSPEMLAVLNRKLREKGLAAPVYEMDICDLSLPRRYDLILIPFNSFAEIASMDEQRQVLQGISTHLTGDGRLICTLHNPAVRRKSIDGQVHLRGRFPLPDKTGTLILSSVENYDDSTRLVTGSQMYEIVDVENRPVSTFRIDLKFYLHSQDTFETLAQSQGFQAQALYGDYSRAAFDPERSPFMIWSLVQG